MMKIELHKMKVKDVFKGFEDDGEDGVFAYDGKLTIRPPYHRVEWKSTNYCVDYFFLFL